MYEAVTVAKRYYHTFGTKDKFEIYYWLVICIKFAIILFDIFVFNELFIPMIFVIYWIN